MSKKRKNRKQRQQRSPARPAKPSPSARSRWLVPVAVIMLVGLAATLLVRGRQSDPKPPAHSDSGQDGTVNTTGPGSMSSDTAAVSVERVDIDDRDRPLTPAGQLAEKFDPAADNWNTEVLNGAASGQLKQLARRLMQLDDVEPTDLASLTDDRFVCGSLVPDELETVFDDGTLSVRRPAGQVLPTADEHQGAPGLAEAMQRLKNELGEGPELRAKFKLFNVDALDDHFTTRQFLEASARDDDRGAQITATWVCRWSYPGDAIPAEPRLLSIGLEAFELVAIRAPGGVLFADCAESVLSQNASYRQQLLPGIDHWEKRITVSEGMATFGHQGLAVGDVNGDGLDDLYVCDTGGLPNRLYVQNPDATLTDVSADAGVDWLDDTKSALIIDLDNDGDQDLAVGAEEFVMFAENDGSGRFTRRGPRHEVVDTYGLSAVDFDADGDLDLYACTYGAGKSYAAGLPVPIPFHDANNGGSNRLLRNEGGFRFVDVTADSGLDQNNARFSFAAAWEDYDNDGDQDLYVANDFGRNNLYRNDPPVPLLAKGGNGGVRRFTDVAAEAGVEDAASGMSVTWGDYDRDGWMDLYVSNMFSAAGNRVTFQRQYTDARAGATAIGVQRMARGNTLFANGGDGIFRDESEAAGVLIGRWAWSSNFADLNNDGWQDLVVANGYITNEDSGDL